MRSGTGNSLSIITSVYGDIVCISLAADGNFPITAVDAIICDNNKDNIVMVFLGGGQ